MLPFLLFSTLYPLNLYIFQLLLSSRRLLDPVKAKVASILVSTSILLAYTNFSSVDFSFTKVAVYWSLMGLLPFLLPFIYSEAEAETEESGAGFLFWRNFFIAPACEELFYRLLLPQLCNSILALSISFSLAHAHPLLLPKNWTAQRLRPIVGQCGVSFCFGVICNKIRIKAGVDGNNFWLFLALALIHGIANYCGVPFILGKSKKINWIQAAILVISIYSILK